MRNNGHTRVPTAEASTSVSPTRWYAGLTEVFMKLRRVMAAAAATAAIAPIALLSAPAAFATDGDTTPPPSSTAPASETPPSTPDETPPTTPAETPPTTPAETPPTTQPGTTPPIETGKPTTEPPETDDPTEEPTEEPSQCPVDEDGTDADSKLEIALSGLPGKIVAGSGWHQFKLTAANPTDEDLGEVQWLAAVDKFTDSEKEKDWLANYAQIQYFNPDSKAWESIADEVTGGLYFGTTELGAKDKVDIKLRLDISAKAPTGDGYALGLGGYLDSEQNCVHESFSYYEFTVLKPGSDNEAPGKAEENEGDKKPSAGKKPQGGAKVIPTTGNLAETGSSSALPTIGLVGGLAVIAGAGAVFVVRRKKADATA
ncbi:LAETG motif-containing sortase-dependent surface protein [Streptomyces sp. NPDC058257]|uniref:LAETG motif-containing sortase-dependent surface protein n=1 Tax=Streptomyces sp. NPDC058257 TaxID=3346409 RepID=UPI0036E9D3A7